MPEYITVSLWNYILLIAGVSILAFLCICLCADAYKTKDKKITNQQLSTLLDKLSKVNSDLIAVFFVINLSAVFFFSYVHEALIESGGDGDASLIIVTGLSTVLVILVHAYSKCSFEPLNNILNMIMILVGIIILDGLIPHVGVHFDVMGVSCKYWNFIDTIITYTVLYLFVFYVINFLVKLELKDA